MVGPDIGSDTGTLVRAVERLGREHGGGLLVAVAAAVDETEPRSLMPLGSQFSSKTVVLFTQARQVGQAEWRRPPPAFVPDTTLLLVNETAGFADAWAEHSVSSEDPSTKRGEPQPRSTAGEPTLTIAENRQ